MGPVTNYASGIQQVKVGYTDRAGYIQEAERWNVPNAALWHEVNRIVGLCYLFKRTVMDRVGYLDEMFSPGHYEDDDYCYRARLAGSSWWWQGMCWCTMKGVQASEPGSRADSRS